MRIFCCWLIQGSPPSHPRCQKVLQLGNWGLSPMECCLCSGSTRFHILIPKILYITGKTGCSLLWFAAVYLFVSFIARVFSRGHTNAWLFLQVLFYIYAIIGMEPFGNLIKTEGSHSPEVNNETNSKNLTQFCVNINLKDSDFYEDCYCNNNFNDILRSFKVLLDLMVVNQWHSILWRR